MDAITSGPVRIVVSGEPAPNLRTRSASYLIGGEIHSHHYLPAKTRSERQVIRQAASFAMEGRELLVGAVDFRATFYRSVPQSWTRRAREAALAGEILPTSKPDVGNLLAMMDALKGIVWRDDAQVSDLHCFKRYSAFPRTVIEIREAHGRGRLV